MSQVDDALLCGYIPLCAHHCEMVPADKRLLEFGELRGLVASMDVEGMAT